MIGTLRKLKRFFRSPSGRAVILPLDHGASDGMLHGIGHFPALMAHLNTRSMQGVILNKGFARAHALELSADIPLILQLSAGTRHGVPSWNKALVCSVPEALRLGADAVAVQLNIGNELEDKMLADFGMAVEEAHQHGLPVLAVIYAKGERIVQELDPSLITHCIRLGGELGADMVSVPYSGDPASFTRAVASCPVPVLVAGGPSQPDFASFLKMTHEALECGAAGVSVGRNVFQQENPEQALDAILELVHTVAEDDEPSGPANPSTGGATAAKQADSANSDMAQGDTLVSADDTADSASGVMGDAGDVAGNATGNTVSTAKEKTGKKVKDDSASVSKPYAAATITPQDVANASEGDATATGNETGNVTGNVTGNAAGNGKRETNSPDSSSGQDRTGGKR